MKTKNYETVFVFTPVLNEGDAKTHVKTYMDFLKKEGAEIVEEDFWGMRQLAYPIQKKTTGIYFVTEYVATGELVDALEVKCKRDNQVLRFLTVRLDKYAMKYNEDKRKGLVGRKRTIKKPHEIKAEADAKAAEAAAREAEKAAKEAAAKAAEEAANNNDNAQNEGDK